MPYSDRASWSVKIRTLVVRVAWAPWARAGAARGSGARSLLGRSSVSGLSCVVTDLCVTLSGPSFVCDAEVTSVPAPAHRAAGSAPAPPAPQTRTLRSAGRTACEAVGSSAPPRAALVRFLGTWVEAGGRVGPGTLACPVFGQTGTLKREPAVPARTRDPEPQGCTTSEPVGPESCL